MKSIINQNNISNLPITFFFLILFIYICPNIKILSIGEMSSLPAFIILLSFSFISLSEIIFFSFIVSLSILSLLLSYLYYQSNLVIIESSLISIYIFCVPIMLAIIIGRMFACRYTILNKEIIIKEIKYLIYFLIFLFSISGLLNSISPDILRTVLFSGRTSFGRQTFFFSEPSQASSVILFIWLFSSQFLLNKKFKKFFGKDSYIYFFITFLFALISSFLSMPGTLYIQLASVIGIFALIVLSISLFKFLFRFKIKIKKFHSLLKIKKVNLILYFLFLSSLFFIIQNIYFRSSAASSSRIDLIFTQIDEIGIFEGFMAAGGFRFYYAFASVKYSLINFFSLPGSWYGTFLNDLLNFLSISGLEISDNVLQIGKPQINLKPLGWLYFCLYDIGFFGFILYLYFSIGKYIVKVFKGILKVDFFWISIFAFQIAILLIPVLPSTPCIFIPLVLVVFSYHLPVYKAKRSYTSFM